MNTINRWNRPGQIGRLGILGLALGAGLAAGGCYTLLGHPRTADPLAGDQAYSGKCLACHAETGYVETGSLPWIAHLRSSNAGWINYYGSPHWLDSRWARVPEDSVPTEAPSGRMAWGRVPLRRAGDENDVTRLRDPLAAPLPLPGPVVPAPSAPAAPANTGNGSAQEEPKEEKPSAIPASGRGLRR